MPTKQEFFKLRIQRVKDTASLYDLLSEIGHEPRYQGRSGQMHCCFSNEHSSGQDLKPSARYYPSEGDKPDAYYCWVCTDHPLDAISFTQRVHNYTFTEALRFLEKKYGIKYDGINIESDIIDDLDLISGSQQDDLKTLLKYCEALLKERKNVLGLKKYVAFSYLLDLLYISRDKSKIERWLEKLTKFE